MNIELSQLKIRYCHPKSTQFLRYKAQHCRRNSNLSLLSSFAANKKPLRSVDNIKVMERKRDGGV